ncbi:hypothetical protein MTR67_047849 [Solanum verrucosum]|uniref:AAA+ ATPase domain-containing protein n=1 Tax=Solanum verrucosum TaxID=315347 RepID=A0AAF0UZS5_SOLVR|nr:hypothetical protein MTR67_047849 [Solanum verrucosum]
MKIIFHKFDKNKDEDLGTTDLVGWIIAVEPTLNNDLQRVLSFLKIYMDTYPSVLIDSKGLFYSGFSLIYTDGLRNLNHDSNTITTPSLETQTPIQHQVVSLQALPVVGLQVQQQQCMLQSYHVQQILLQLRAQKQVASLVATNYSHNSTFSNNNLIDNIYSAGMNDEEGIDSTIMYDGPHPELVDRLEKEILDTNSGVKWDDIARLSEAKRILQEATVLPSLMPAYFQGIRRPSRGFLLLGPKTLLPKVIATECGTTFLNISCSSLCGECYGERERLTQCLFEIARSYAPTTIFIDEIDSLCSARGSGTEHEKSRRVKSKLLVQIDGLHNSNSLCYCKRRLEKRIYFPLPEFKSCKELIKINLKSIKLAPRLDILQVAQRTEGYSGDDLTNIYRDASFNGMRQEISGKTTMDDLLEALDKIQPTFSTEDIQRYEKWLSDL